MIDDLRSTTEEVPCSHHSGTVLLPPYKITESFSLEDLLQQQQQAEESEANTKEPQQQQSEPLVAYTSIGGGMARFGKSFADMAEAMLGDEYVSSHNDLLLLSHPNLKTSTSSQVVHSFLDGGETNSLHENIGGTATTASTGLGYNNNGLPPSALRRKPSITHATTGDQQVYNEKYNKQSSGGSSSFSRISTSYFNAPDSAMSKSPEKRNPDSRSVVIQDPPKRQKMGGTSVAGAPGRQQQEQQQRTTSDVVHALYKAVSQQERLDAIQDAICTFDHDDRDVHDAEIAMGADIALVKALTFVEFKAGFRREPIQADMEAISREIGLILKALECVYRANSEAVGESFDRVGTDLLHILVILIDDEVKNRMQAMSPESSPESSYQILNRNEERGMDTHSAGDDEGRDSKRSVTPPLNRPTLYGKNNGVENLTRDIVLRKTTKIIGHFARVGKATRPLAHFPGFLGSILNLINMRPYSTIPFEARLSCLWTIANLACNTDNMTMMLCTPNLVNSLISIGCRQSDHDDSLETIMETLRAKSIASRALLNLSWSPENKIIMSENNALVQVLAQLSLERRSPFRNSKTIQDIMVSSRRHAIGALRNMAAAPRRLKVALCQYNSGKLLDALTDAALSETDSTAIDLVYSTIHNLAVHDTAEAIVDRPALVLALKNVLLNDDGISEGSNNPPSKNSRKSHASSTILVLERSITPEMPCYENLRELLDAVNPTNESDEDDSNTNSISSSNDIVAEAVNTTAV